MRWFVYLAEDIGLTGKVNVQILIIRKKRGAPFIAQSVENLPAIQETQILFLGQEDPLEKEMTTHSSILAWRILWTEESSMGLVHEVARAGHDLVTKPPSQK